MMNTNSLIQDLRMMPDEALKRIAEMYHDDPMVLPLVVAEDTARKQIRSSAEAQQGEEATVADQAVQNVGMPEDTGIAALQAPNLQQMPDGGIAGYADGGVTESYQNTDMSPGMLDFADRSEPVVRMARGGTNVLGDYSDLIRSESERYGLDPNLMMRLFMTESSGDPNAVSKKGAMGLGQLMEDAAKDMGLSKEERSDPVKNIKASIGYFARQVKNNGGDLKKAAVAYNWGPGRLKEHLAKYDGEINEAKLPDETRGYLKKLGVSVGAEPGEEGARPGSFAAPATAVGAGTGVAGLLGGMGAQELARATFKPGTTAGQAATRLGVGAGAVPSAVLGGGAAATKYATDVLAAASPEQRAQFYETPGSAYNMIGALGGDTAFAAAILNAAEGQPIKPPEKPSSYGQQMGSAFKFLATQPGKLIANAPSAIVDTLTGAKDYSTGQGAWLGGEEGLPPLSPIDPKDPRLQKLAEGLKDNPPPGVEKKAKKEGWEAEDWLALAAGILRSPSRYFTQALGEGLGALAQSRTARRKEEREAAEAEGMAKYREALAGKAAQETEELKAGRSALAIRQKAVALAQQDLEKDIIAKMLPADQQQKWLSDRALQYMQLIGVPAANTMGGIGGGFRVLGVRPGT